MIIEQRRVIKDVIAQGFIPSFVLLVIDWGVFGKDLWIS